MRAVGEGGFFSLTAYGEEADFVYPPRPADPRTPWSPQWTVKVRYRSATGGILGMDMSAMMGGGGGGYAGDNGPRPPQGQPPQQKPPRRPGGLLGGLGGVWP